nr:uncharacterized protein LOC109150426 [Ipomoea batatas]
MKYLTVMEELEDLEVVRNTSLERLPAGLRWSVEADGLRWRRRAVDCEFAMEAAGLRWRRRVVLRWSGEEGDKKQSVFDRIGEVQPRQSVFHRLGSNLKPAKRKSIHDRLGAARVLKEHINTSIEIESSKRLRSAVPSRMRREIDIHVSCDEVLKVKPKTIIYTRVQGGNEENFDSSYGAAPTHDEVAVSSRVTKHDEIPVAGGAYKFVDENALKECSPPYIKHTIISILQQLRRLWTPNTGESSDVTSPDLRCFREGLPANLAASTVKKQGCRSKLQSISSNVNRRSRTSKKQSVGNDNRLR